MDEVHITYGIHATQPAVLSSKELEELDGLTLDMDASRDLKVKKDDDNFTRVSVNHGADVSFYRIVDELDKLSRSFSMLSSSLVEESSSSTEGSASFHISADDLPYRDVESDETWKEVLDESPGAEQSRPGFEKECTNSIEFAEFCRKMEEFLKEGLNNGSLYFC